MALPQENPETYFKNIKQRIARLSAIVNECEKATLEANGEQIHGPSMQLSAEALNLLRTVQGPVGAFLEHPVTVSRTGALRALLEVGVFDKLPEDGSSRTAAQLSEDLGIEKELLVRLMRNVTYSGPFEEVGPEEYKHSEYSKFYLTPQHRAFFKMMVDEHLPSEGKFLEFFQRNGWVNVRDPQNTPYTFAHYTNGVPFYDHISTIPKRLANFNTAMGIHTPFWKGVPNPYPFREEVLKCGNSTEETPLIVDIGGGEGHTLIRIRKECGGIPGRYIVEDQDAVVKGDDEKSRLGIEVIPHDFFKPQPVKGAYIYHIRHCLHNWSDNECVTILENIVSAMEPGKSRLLIAEFVLPETNAVAEAVWLDLCMLSHAGRERTEKEWAAILERAGLELLGVHLETGLGEAVMEAGLKE